MHRRLHGRPRRPLPNSRRPGRPEGGLQLKTEAKQGMEQVEAEGG